ncbi:hypothetical protein H5410_061603 [Solanum commersonii]|uniref:Uncharacterized protein n=1 Tax=Solanum commersonii TaxID=4109 RepID=A0A9J5W8B4_SOLCO|nr:hypothetical protein H5410_061603 [Solanum commersonii]
MELKEKHANHVKYFKFLNYWTDQQSFKEKVKNCWNQTLFGPFIKKFKRLTSTLRSWSSMCSSKCGGKQSNLDRDIYSIFRETCNLLTTAFPYIKWSSNYNKPIFVIEGSTHDIMVSRVCLITLPDNIVKLNMDCSALEKLGKTIVGRILSNHEDDNALPTKQKLRQKSLDYHDVFTWDITRSVKFLNLHGLRGNSFKNITISLTKFMYLSEITPTWKVITLLMFYQATTTYTALLKFISPVNSYQKMLILF